MNAGKLKLTHAVRSLDLPSRLSYRLARALDYGLRNRAAGVETMRRTIAEVALVLFGRCGNASVVVEQMRGIVIEHLEERGVRISSVLAAAPVPVIFAEEIAGITAKTLGLELGATGELPKSQIGRWIARARELNKP
jgi:hypothetical protein